jgi:hypothetical protein
LLQQIAAFSAHFGKYRRWVSVNLAENFAEIGENMRRFQAGFPEQVGILAQNGWFISLDTPLAAIYPVADLFRAGNVTEGHKQMCGHFSRIRQDIEDNLTTSFPERRRILQKAFRAHDAGDYELSVPVFLAQADGIAKKILGVSIYSRKSAVVRRMGDVIANIAAEELEDSLLRVVLKALPLTASTGSGAQGAGELNRHEVLHGIDTQYATELNSYRAISWLQCAAHFDEAKKCSNRRSQKVGQADVPKP